MIFKIIEYKKQKSFYRKLLKKGDLCFDIGANTGVKSKLFLEIGATVIAFEPQTDCNIKLQKISNRYPQFSFHNYGIGSTKAKKQLHIGSHSEIATFSEQFMSFFKTETIFWNTTKEVNVYNIMDIIKKFGIPNYCKIDTEGYEFKIIKHLKKPIPIIEFEFTAGFIKETIQTIDILSKFGTTTWNYNLNERPRFELKKWIDSQEIIKIFKTLPKHRLHGNLFVKTVPNSIKNEK